MIMPEWLAALLEHAGPAILVTVAQAQGSVPREPGAKMLVTAERQFDTIGGGHLELSAIGFAREMLASCTSDLMPPRLERFALGPTLGQCCGGVVHLAFEHIDAAAVPMYDAVRQRIASGEDSWRVCSSVPGTAPVLLGADRQSVLGDAHVLPSVTAGCASSSRLLHGPEREWTLIDPVSADLPQLILFGAGHVGAAVVRAMAPLPCRITWVDEREDLFPSDLPANVRIEATDVPEALIDAAPCTASFLVMTHSHALDQRLAECILTKSGFGWFGLIGSHTKRIQFERRLAARGIAGGRIANMVCPIGMPGIHGKQPAVIAAAVAAQLLQAWEHMQVESEHNAGCTARKDYA
jgi:xanthine dehydrogenase accessory factor